MLGNEQLFSINCVKNISKENTKLYSNKYNLDLDNEEISAYTIKINDLLPSFSNVFLKEERLNLSVYPRLIINGLNPLNAFSSLCTLKGSKEGLLKGKKFVIKDSILLAGIPISCGSALIEGTIPNEDSTIVIRILENGGEICGKSRCEDLSFSLNSFTCNSGIVMNPIDLTRTCGGSSGGSAALVAGEYVDIGIGTDAGGSIRIPAASCKIIGLKPTFGLVPITGAFGLEATLDHLGPMARNVKDIALFMNIAAGPDDFDQRYYTYLKYSSFSSEYLSKDEGKNDWEIQSKISYGINTINVNYTDAYDNYVHLLKGVKNVPLKIGIFDQAVNRCEDHIKNNFNNMFIPIFKKHLSLNYGGSCEYFKDDTYDTINDVFLTIVTLGFYDLVFTNDNSLVNSFNRYNTNISKITHANKSTNSRDLGHTSKLIMILSEYLKDKYGNKFYTHANNLRKELSDHWRKLFEQYDLIILPTITEIPPKLPNVNISIDNYISESLKNKNNTCIFNLLGYPALTIDWFRKERNSDNFCPIMIVGKHFHDHRVIQLARYIEEISK